VRFDLVVRNGRVVDGDEVLEADVGISEGVVAALGPGLGPGDAEIEAGGRYVIPGGVDSHVHLGQVSSMGDVTADDFWTGSRSAVHGGTTTIVPFAAQHRGLSVLEVLHDALERARQQATIDFAFHVIITDWARAEPELRQAAGLGIVGVKVYLTYDRLKLDGSQILAVMAAARDLGLTVMVHAEDDAMVTAGRERAIAAGESGARGHAASHSRSAELAGVTAAIALAEEAGTALYLAHISTPEAVAVATGGRARGLDVTVETCPHYLLLDESLLDQPIETAAPFMSSPPVRGSSERAGLLAALARGEIDIVASDHSPYTMEQKLPDGAATSFTRVANGLPGVELRLPLLYSACVASSVLSITDFVRLISTNPAKACGLYPRKGSLAPGADADLVVWSEEARTVDYDALHDAVGYTPYEGMELTGWPEVVIARGEVLVAEGSDATSRARGKFVARLAPAGERG
jgi:dihydropyrimidinase